MPTYPSALSYYDAFVSALEKTTRTRGQEFRKLGEATFRDYRELTSGSLSTATLRAMGHPYARSGGVARGPSRAYMGARGVSRPKGVAPLLPINRQTGALQRSVRVVHRSSRFTVEDSVLFDPAVAGRSLYVLSATGTGRMVARGLQREADRRIGARLRAFNDTFQRLENDAFASPKTP